MILVDAGPLIALIDAGEADHERCVEAASDLSTPLVTTWPAFTEAMYLLGSAGGWVAQEALWKLTLRSELELLELGGRLKRRSRDLMAKYRDVPMDLADASLVAAAESLGTRRVFSLDADFLVYRYKGRQSFELVPGFEP